MEELPGNDEVKMSQRGGVDNVKNSVFIGVDVGAWVISGADVHLVEDSTVEDLGLATGVKDDHCSAEKGKDQEYTAAINKGGGRDEGFVGFIGVY